MSGWEAFGSAIAGAIIGGGITGYFTLRAARQAHENDLALEEQKENSVIEGLLQAFHDEIETIWDRYQEGMGVHLETLPQDQPLLMYYPVVNDYFTVYNSNAFLIGRIKDHDLRKEIVSLYTTAKGLVDSFRLNNDLVQKFEYWETLHQESQKEIHKNKAIAYYQSLTSYAKTIRKQHDILKEQTARILRTLRKGGVLTNNQHNQAIKPTR